MRLLTLCGSLRAGSSNSACLEALALLAPAGVSVAPYDGLDQLPFFNPDVETAAPPRSVLRLRQAVGQADALVICSPEYAHGVSGLMKNALDWLVGSLEFPDKPVALINASPRAHHADDHTREILKTMNARFLEEASVAVPLQGRGLDSLQIADDPDLAAVLRASLFAIHSVLTSELSR